MKSKLKLRDEPAGDHEVEALMKEAKAKADEIAVKKGTLKVEEKNDFKDINAEEKKAADEIEKLANKGDILHNEAEIKKKEGEMEKL